MAVGSTELQGYSLCPERTGRTSFQPAFRGAPTVRPGHVTAPPGLDFPFVEMRRVTQRQSVLMTADPFTLPSRGMLCPNYPQAANGSASKDEKIKWHLEIALGISSD